MKFHNLMLFLFIALSISYIHSQNNAYEQCLAWCKNNPNNMYGFTCPYMCKGKYQGQVESLGHEVQKVAQKGISTIKHVTEEGIDKAKACSEVVALGSEWAAKEGAFQTAKGVLESAKQLQKADPRLTGLEIAQHSAELGLEAANKALYVAQQTSEGIAKGTNILGKIASEAFNIESISFETTAKELLKGEVPPVKVTGNIAGQHFNVTIPNVNFSSKDSFVNSILDYLKNLGNSSILSINI